MTGGPDVRAIVDGGRGRRRRAGGGDTTVLLEELADDAAATARVLADACVAIGGRGAPGRREPVVAYLAAELPGWGDLELARRGPAWPVG